ncbi:peamaclein-like [Impatiens glandulifera]|uniref:peamaclein-like n=1 Tax=Impatiens glandulifera TaxID=253017 RepID=UPI001FB06CA4|nr:peamaclein-like [Impatiens glandulifera]
MKNNGLAALLVVSIILTSSLFQSTMAAVQPPASSPNNSEFCQKKCEVRCSKAGAHKRCMQECKICCSKCNCVPSGTYGNKSECPCYANLLNSKGTSKCP